MRRGEIRRLGLACVIAAALAVPASASAAGPGLQARIDSLVKNPAGPPGVAVLVTRNDERQFFHAGVADVRTHQAPRIDDHFRIASVSKGFNSLVAVSPRLRERGVTLGTKLGRFIPDVLPRARRVTVAQALQHTSGIADYIRQKKFLEVLTSAPKAYLSPLRLTRFVKREPLEFAPDSRYAYSDTDNIAVGLLAERATGKTYDDLLESAVFDPFGMTRTTLPDTVRMPRPYIHGYEVERGKKPEDVSKLINPAGAWASGGIVSTPSDLARFLPRYVPTVLRASRGLKHRFRRGSSSPPGPGYNAAGIGIFRYSTKCGRVYGHTGSFPGYRTLIAASADGTRSVVFSVNAQIVPGSGAPKVAKAITRAQVAAVCLALSE